MMKQKVFIGPRFYKPQTKLADQEIVDSHRLLLLPHRYPHHVVQCDEIPFLEESPTLRQQSYQSTQRNVQKQKSPVAESN